MGGIAASSCHSNVGWHGDFKGGGASEFVVRRTFTPSCQKTRWCWVLHALMPFNKLSLGDAAGSVPLTIRQGGGELA